MPVPHIPCIHSTELAPLRVMGHGRHPLTVMNRASWSIAGLIHCMRVALCIIRDIVKGVLISYFILLTLLACHQQIHKAL